VVDYIYSEETTEEKKELEVAQQAYFSKIADEKILLNEQFDKNEADWPHLTNSELGKGNFSNGVLTYENVSKNYIQSSRNIPLNWAMDFTISAKIRRKAGRTDNLYGVMFSYRDWDNYYYFGFAPNGYWKMRKVKDKKEAYTSGWKKTDLVKTDEYNDLKIMKVNDQLLYFVNDNLVYNRKETERLGNNIGMVICDSAVAMYDHLKVTQQYRTEQEQAKMLKKYIDSDKTSSNGNSKTESIRDKKHLKHRTRINDSWRGKPVLALQKAWGNPYKSESWRLLYRYKIIGGKQYYYQIVTIDNGNQYGKVVSEIYFTTQ
ncbi:MAG: hypothetical protein WBA74_11425, partial [Cyclobacteriaceae bacterium]